MTLSTRERIVAESLRLFADRGYAATSVAEIEAAAGLSPGAGGLYRHFRSKEEVLAAAIREHITRTREQIATVMEIAAEHSDLPLETRLKMACKTGLAKMREEQDLIRVLFRDLDQFPNLIAEMREGLVKPLYDSIATWLSAQPEYADADADWPAIATVLGGAVVNYWLSTESLHESPTRVDESRFVEAWARLALGLVTNERSPA
ncbi:MULTISPECIES: TetR/AcrR family transcriptional regulator [Thermomonospora]|uniref:Transcriptional regulator, TetR family n=1 Tax=Thermomonospora curvata (strain ATCC 19995 / DSM 43183 / JCM 3096 / KCTC 9072 / NBRC 15933 / NCIMB 10081 / Henssen B9) TaxID=471852 RepID=D1A5P5_THECD|nr:MULTISPECIES: TetR/AcrR family transcriptional regulator [Thermomonospora]ACY96405.1 transcriptional regulator, TetR family [Thermomonospora curvata DSM 43183]PKK15807.1 MAG: TetR/AcrR family transcriptional regulator [Thermomonospora sp. CIF 1]